MTINIDTIKGMYAVEITTREVPFFGTTYDSVIRKGGKVTARISDLRQAGHGFAPNPWHNDSLTGMSEIQAVMVHKEAIRIFKAKK